MFLSCLNVTRLTPSSSIAATSNLLCNIRNDSFQRAAKVNYYTLHVSSFWLSLFPNCVCRSQLVVPSLSDSGSGASR